MIPAYAKAVSVSKVNVDTDNNSNDIEKLSTQVIELQNTVRQLVKNLSRLKHEVDTLQSKINKVNKK